MDNVQTRKPDTWLAVHSSIEVPIRLHETIKEHVTLELGSIRVRHWARTIQSHYDHLRGPG